jgi:hypothetical protein
VKKNPATFLPEYALTLNNLGRLYRVMRQTADAGIAYAGALAAYRDLARRSPEVNLPYVASTLSNVGDLRVLEHRRADARTALEEARAILQRFATVAPATYELQLKQVESTLHELGE